MIGEDILDTPVTCHYMMLINTLNCVDSSSDSEMSLYNSK